MSALRSGTAWVDPEVQIWNRSLLDNLHYGVPSAGRKPLSVAIQRANLLDVLERLPDGLQTVLGEGGGLVSGGEGQRVRLGRALLRQDCIYLHQHPYMFDRSVAENIAPLSSLL